MSRETLTSTRSPLDKLSASLDRFYERRVDAASKNGEEMLTQMKLLAKLVGEQNEMLKRSLGSGLQVQSADQVHPVAATQESEIKEPLKVSMRSMILKLKMEKEVHRVQLSDECLSDLRLRHVSEAIEKTLPDLSGMCIPKYLDHDGDLCNLTSSSFNDFLGFASEKAGEKVLTVHLCLENTSPVPKQGVSLQKRPASGAPSILHSFMDLFTMGFAVDRIKILETQGPDVLAERLRGETADLSVISTLLLSMVFEMWLMLVGGDLDLILYGDNQEIDWHYFVFLGLMVGSIAGFCVSVLSTIILSLMLNNIIDDNVEAFVRDAGLFLRLPYLGSVYGQILFLGSVNFLAFFQAEGITTGIVVAGASTVAAIMVFGASTKYIHAAYMADFSGSGSK